MIALNFDSIGINLPDMGCTYFSPEQILPILKPLDEELILALCKTHKLLVTLEENAVMGGAGSAVNEFLNQQAINIPTLNIGLPDQYMEHGKHEQLLSDCGLDAQGIQTRINERWQLHNPT